MHVVLLELRLVAVLLIPLEQSDCNRDLTCCLFDFVFSLMQFACTKFIHNNALAFFFRKPLTHKADKESDLAQKTFSEFFDKKFNHIFSSSVQDPAEITIAKELDVEKT